MTRLLQHLFFTWLSCSLADAFTTAPNQFQSSFLGQSSPSPSPWHSSTSISSGGTFMRGGTIKMDMEEPYSHAKTKFKVPLPQFQTHLHIPKPPQQQKQEQTVLDNKNRNMQEIDLALAQHGMPWKSSIDPTYANPRDPTSQELFYMPFFEWQLDFMKTHLTDLRLVPTASQQGQDLTYLSNPDQQVRMVTYTFSSKEFRKIRMTVYDAGNRTQVFTSLWYPNEDYNLPVLGTDLLQFASGTRHLCVVDLQPTSSSTKKYEHLLKPIRDHYPSLQGRMTKRFYDESQFFSQQMLYSRFDDWQASQQSHPAYTDLFPAYQQYVQTHLSLIQTATPNPHTRHSVRQGQAAYDAYSAVRDPAHAMFAKVFGPDVADAFVYDVLFSYSKEHDQQPQV
ncbi:dihydrobiliverdin:ferredoxin oxidoreductase [Seminavis robusta]|uniref:Dihydrobiliverdin:ferredoxin oxidoreductase n=1 Tax=Seminavis robusta TaxID=568900 RepID=A0A9N8HMI2_9STRA|nr:dihydrobiliverdin:ferredoxin oxidoreductase [Seminavis robusta]|eukprot:Sro1121_g243430.1 dihydrobiliverdin:ferredoxin oxidoreductase (393) ;mRNA; f:26717-27895